MTTSPHMNHHNKRTMTTSPHINYYPHYEPLSLMHCRFTSIDDFPKLLKKAAVKAFSIGDNDDDQEVRKEH